MRKIALTAFGAGAIGFFLGLMPAGSASQAATGQSAYPGSAGGMRVPETVGMGRTEPNIPAKPGMYFPPPGEAMTNQARRQPAEVGLNPEIISALKSRASKDRWALWRDGYLVHVEGDFNRKQDVASLRKTWHALTVGAALKQGRIPSLGQKISVWSPELTGRHAEATWWHVITQTSGFDYPYGDYPAVKPGEMWTYSDKNPRVLCSALARVYGKKDFRDNYAEVVRPAYFDAIGMTGWAAVPNQDGARFHFDLEDMGRLGLLVLARGRWNGVEVIPPWFVEQLERKQTDGVRVNFNGPDDGKVGLDPHQFPEVPYGFMTWVNTDGDYYPGADKAWAWGAGAGGTYVLWNRHNGIVFAGVGIDTGPTANGIPHLIERTIAGPNPLVETAEEPKDPPNPSLRLTAVYPGKAWETCTPEEVGMDRTGLDALRDFVGGGGCIVRHGHMVYSWGDPTLRGNVYSACKPWFSHFLFKTVEEGKIPSLDQKVNVWEPRLNGLNAALGFKDREITWRHLANQTSCYGVKEKPGTAFNYNDYQMALFWDTLFLKVYGVTYDAVDAKVLHPQLTDLLQCQDNPTFMALGSNRQMGLLGVSPRDFARFALLYLRAGNWKGNQLISREHARMAVTSPMSSSLPNSEEELAEMIPGQRTIGRVALPQKQGGFGACYSWLWWVNGVTRQGKHHWPDAPLETYAALGAAGNATVVIPSLDLVVVWSIGWRSDGRYPDTNQALQLLVESVRRKLTTQGDLFFLDGQPFRMWGIRTASATKDDAQTDHLIAQLDDYLAHGVNAVTVFYMGSSGGNYDPFSPDGLRLDAGHQRRMERIIRACDARGMVVIVGIFYQHAPWGLRDAEAVRNAVRTVTRSLKPYRNVIINVANEQNSDGWKDTAAVFDFREPARIIELCRIVHQEDPGRLVGGGGYDHAKNPVIGASPEVDMLLFDTDGPQNSGTLYDRFVAAGVKGKPIVNVEMFGGWTKRLEGGVVPASAKKAYFDEVDAAFARPGLSAFFHHSPWCQGPVAMRYDLAGDGAEQAPGIRWYFDYLHRKKQTAGPGQENSLTDEEQEAGWRLLFDGKTTEGWRGYKMTALPPGWKARDGVLVRVSGGAGGKGAGGGDDIVTMEEFENFDLQLEWKLVPKGNSGVLYHVSEEPLTAWHYAPEVQILDNPAYPKNNQRQLAGACYDLYAPSKDVTKPPGQWNHMRILVDDAHVEHWLNGEKVVEYELGSDDWNQRVANSKHKGRPQFGTFKRGPICLQDHTNSVEFRNIKIRPLPAKEQK